MALSSERSKKIEAAINQPSALSEMGKAPVVIAGTRHLLPVYRLPTSFLAYNIRNGRFAAELLAKEEQLGRQLNPLLLEDEVEVRKLLLELDPGATLLLKRDIKAVGQTDPGIITHDGFVINGNRRMAILWELHQEDPTGKYQYLEVQRLPPDVSDRDLWRIEAGLQLSRDKRLEYGPVNDLLKIHEGLQAGLSYEEIAATLYGVEDAKEVEAKEKRLALIDSYLDFIGEQGAYTKANGLVEHFINLQDFLRWLDKQRISKKEQLAWLLRAFEMIRANMGHMELRRLRNIYQSETAKKHFIASIKPKQGKPKDQGEQERNTAEIKEQFDVAKDYQELEADAKQPQLVLDKAQRAMQTLLQHKPEIAATALLHVGVAEILKMAQELAAACQKPPAEAKRRK